MMIKKWEIVQNVLSYMSCIIRNFLHCYTPSLHHILTFKNKINIYCKTVLWTGQEFIDLLPAVELLALFSLV